MKIKQLSRTWKAEARRALSSSTAWLTKRIEDQPGPHRETLSPQKRREVRKEEKERRRERERKEGGKKETKNQKTRHKERYRKEGRKRKKRKSFHGNIQFWFITWKRFNCKLIKTSGPCHF